MPKKLFLLFSTLSGIISIFTALAVNAQEAKKYNGPYLNGWSEPGEATYSYYIDAKSQMQVKHGAFRYSLKSEKAEEGGRFTQSIIGNYVHGLKNGNWSYIINTKDYLRDDQGFYLTGNITLNASYKNGYPDGAWSYVSNTKKRKQKDNPQGTSSRSWQSYTPQVVIKLRLHFSNGCLVDSFFLSINEERSIEGMFDAKGLFDGEWSEIKGDVQELTTWVHGVKKQIIQKNIITGETIQKQDFLNDINMQNQYLNAKKIGKTGDLVFIPDTLSLMQTDQELANMIRTALANDTYFLHSYITGDNNCFKSENRIQFILKGAYQVRFINQVSNSQQAVLTNISKQEVKIKEIKAETDKLTKGKALSAEAKKKLQELNDFSAQAEKYTCLAYKLPNELDFQLGYQKAKEHCNKLYKAILSLPDFKTEDEALNYILQQMNSLVKAAESNRNIIKTETGTSNIK